MTVREYIFNLHKFIIVVALILWWAGYFDIITFKTYLEIGGIFVCVDLVAETINLIIEKVRKKEEK